MNSINDSRGNRYRCNFRNPLCSNRPFWIRSTAFIRALIVTSITGAKSFIPVGWFGIFVFSFITGRISGLHSHLARTHRCVSDPMHQVGVRSTLFTKIGYTLRVLGEVSILFSFTMYSHVDEKGSPRLSRQRSVAWCHLGIALRRCHRFPLLHVMANLSKTHEYFNFWPSIFCAINSTRYKPLIFNRFAVHPIDRAGSKLTQELGRWSRKGLSAARLKWGRSEYARRFHIIIIILWSETSPGKCPGFPKV